MKQNDPWLLFVALLPVIFMLPVCFLDEVSQPMKLVFVIFSITYLLALLLAVIINRSGKNKR